MDLVVANSQSGNISVLLGDGNGGLGVSKDVAQGQGPRTVVVADASGDQKLDLLVGDLSGATYAPERGRLVSEMGAWQNHRGVGWAGRMGGLFRRVAR